MKLITIIVLAGILVACSGSSPTAPSPAPVTPPVAVVPPVVMPPVTPARNPLLDDPRFDPAFYKTFVHDAYDNPAIFQPLRRQTQAPSIYLMTVDDTGAPIDSLTLDQTAAALIDVAGKLTGVFGLEGLERGRGPMDQRANRITVFWVSQNVGACGRGAIGGNTIHLYPRTPGCRCPGGPAVRLKTVKHELGHVLGFYHTDAATDLMRAGGSACDMQPSDREIFHARVAYSLPIGSLNP